MRGGRGGGLNGITDKVSWGDQIDLNLSLGGKLLSSDQPKPEFEPKPKYRNFGLVWAERLNNTETETKISAETKTKTENFRSLLFSFPVLVFENGNEKYLNLIPNFETENFFSAIFLKKELFEGLFIFACFLFFSFLLLLLLFLFNFSFRTFFFLFFLCFFCYLFYNSQIFVTETFFFFFYVAEPDAW